MSTSTPCESLGDFIERGFFSTEPLERALAIPLDAASAAALRHALAIDPNARRPYGPIDGPLVMWVTSFERPSANSISIATMPISETRS